MKPVEKTLELVARVIRLQAMALPGEHYDIEYSGTTNELSFWKATGETDKGWQLHFALVHYYGEDYGHTLDEIEAKIKDEEDIHRDLI